MSESAGSGVMVELVAGGGVVEFPCAIVVAVELAALDDWSDTPTAAVPKLPHAAPRGIRGEEYAVLMYQCLSYCSSMDAGRFIKGVSVPGQSTLSQHAMMSVGIINNSTRHRAPSRGAWRRIATRESGSDPEQSSAPGTGNLDWTDVYWR